MFSSALGNMNGLGETIREATPLLFTAVGFAIASKAGFFNIGLPGQAQAGWLTSVWFVLANPNMPKYILLPLAIITGALAGAIVAGIAGFLRAYFGTNEVITTIMLNYIVLYGCQDLMQQIMPENWRNGTDTTKNINYKDIATVSQIPTTTSQLDNDSNFITNAALTGYATETWVEQKGYLTSVAWGDITGKPTLSTVATSGSYNDLIDKPTIPTTTNELTNNSGFITSAALTGYATETWVGEQGYQTASDVSTAISSQTKETWTFTLSDGSTVTKSVVLGA